MKKLLYLLSLGAMISVQTYLSAMPQTFSSPIGHESHDQCHHEALKNLPPLNQSPEDQLSQDGPMKDFWKWTNPNGWQSQELPSVASASILSDCPTQLHYTIPSTSSASSSSHESTHQIYSPHFTQQGKESQEIIEDAHFSAPNSPNFSAPPLSSFSLVVQSTSSNSHASDKPLSLIAANARLQNPPNSHVALEREKKAVQETSSTNKKKRKKNKEEEEEEEEEVDDEEYNTDDDGEEYNTDDDNEKSNTDDDEDEILSYYYKSPKRKKRPFLCTYFGCTYASASKYALKDHIHTHTGEKPYVCFYCLHRTAKAGVMRYHIRTRHPSMQ